MGLIKLNLNPGENSTPNLPLTHLPGLAAGGMLNICSFRSTPNVHNSCTSAVRRVQEPSSAMVQGRLQTAQAGMQISTEALAQCTQFPSACESIYPNCAHKMSYMAHLSASSEGLAPPKLPEAPSMDTASSSFGEKMSQEPRSSRSCSAVSGRSATVKGSTDRLPPCL